jgi:hypothetical protein
MRTTVKDHLTAGGFPTSDQKPAPRRKPVSSDSGACKGRILQFRDPRNDTDPQGPDPTPHRSPSVRPCQFILDDYRDNVLMAVRQGRDYRNIARQYGVSALDIWRIVTDALQTRRAA